MHAKHGMAGSFLCQSGASDQVGVTRGSVGGDVISKVKFIVELESFVELEIILWLWQFLK
jgi:hypothetical protein